MKSFACTLTLIATSVIGFTNPLVAQEGSPLRITEFMASNGGALLDEDGAATDWIEIHNASDAVVNLNGWHLSNDDSALAQWTFPTQALEPDGFLIVYASGKDRASDDGEFLHTNFKLAVESEFLALVEPDGATIASVFEPYASQVNGYSYGFDSDGGLRYFVAPTPGAANSEGIEGFVSSVQFDVERGFFEESFTLTLTCETEGAQIRYTINGREPSLFSGKAYTEPITIDATTIIRAIAKKSGHQDAGLTTQSYLFPKAILRQSVDGSAPEGWPEGSVKGQQFYYQMHDAMLDRLGEAAMLESLRSLPSLSLVTALDNLVSPKDGIYVNAEQRGVDWERPASLELLTPSGEPGFEVSCGLRIRGGISRGGEFPKHSFRVLFREQYGDAKLRYPLFEDEGVDEFDNIDLRSSTNWDWASVGNFLPGARQNTLLRDINSRDTQGALGMPYTRSRYYHLYLNGVYWGVYMTQERAEASYAESYLGGDKEDYDVVKINRGAGAHTEATDGTLDAWRELHTQARAHQKTPSIETYMAMQGLHPDGSRNLEIPVLLNVDRLIDYMLIIFWTANNDAPISQWGDNDWSNNWYGIRNRTRNDEGFHFFVHDAENSYGINGYNTNLNGGVITTTDRTGPFTGSSYRSGAFDQFNPQFLHQDLMMNPEYQLRFADRVQKHCFNEGALTDAAVGDRFRRRRDQVANAIPAHAARWGHRFASSGFSHDEREWEQEVNRILTDFIPGRTKILLEQLRDDDLLALVATPAFSQHGGSVSKGFPLKIEATLTGTQKLYYTLDGSDPRLPGGFLSPDAQLYNLESAGILLTASTTVSARIQEPTLFDPNGRWSALAEAHFLVGSVPADASNLALSEIHYHPAEPSDAEREAGFTADKSFEFLELYNPSDHAVSLRGVRIVDGVEFAFGEDTEIPAGARLVIARSASAFALRYGEKTGPVVGDYAGSLSNGGERIALVDAQQNLILEVTYDDALPWPEDAGGEGFSLTQTNPQAGEGNNPDLWLASTVLGGSPGLGQETTIMDSDGDGATDVEEAIAGTDPNDPASVFEMLAVHRVNDGVELKWSSVAGMSYRVDYVKSLTNAPWRSIFTHVADGDVATVIDADTDRNERKEGFYRAVVAE